MYRFKCNTGLFLDIIVTFHLQKDLKYLLQKEKTHVYEYVCVYTRTHTHTHICLSGIISLIQNVHFKHKCYIK